MKKLLFSLVVMALIGVSCDCPAPANEGEQAEKTAEMAPKALDINNFDATAEGLGDQIVEVTGTVVHTCKHGGTKMFITGDDPDFRLKVTATDESGNFNLEMEGSDYVVVGILEEYKVDMAELDKLEADVLAENPAQEEMKHKGGHEGEGDAHADHEGDSHQEVEGSCATELAQIADLRAQVKDSEKGYLSFYSILAKSYKEAK
ncbi:MULTISPECIES: hypothetical protein [unclassified Lentimicrobium]|uniref:hypothetical protein n=1 Tax=unclassified Lentimicrobium TaxID=2677434 RepID=UPI0015555EFF|nr:MULTISPECIES: hypothetical protein [unclassified Lentimicrobium]NPD45696.1 hypothetical protein [Lentimicrobium sp. S6]NPD85575.1 hypothetical protein [Lentimicrobium sp. L6]